MGRNFPREAEKNLSKICCRIKKAKRVFLFLDYDGTLTPIRKKPSLAKISSGTRKLLSELSKKKWIKVFIISGRSIKNLRGLIRLKSIYYVGNHGFEAEGSRLHYVHPEGRRCVPVMKELQEALRKNIAIKGVVFDDKKYTLSVHYRMVKEGAVQELKKIFRKTISNFNKKSRIKVAHGKKVFEIRPSVAWDKGKAVKKLIKNKKNILPIMIGDDITDEDAFRELKARGISILVALRKKKSYAKYRLLSTDGVREFLKIVLEAKN